MNADNQLATPWNLGNLQISNRIVMAPMSTNRVDESGNSTTDLIQYLRQRAVGGCGMIMIESATVESRLGSAGRTLRLDDDSCLDSYQELVSALAPDCRVVAQLWHAGPRAEVRNGSAVGPSATPPDFPSCRQLDEQEIVGLIGKFVEAADRAVRCGVDAVEIHAAHGYLLHHFVDRETNRRRDEYGGNLSNRFRILFEIRTGIAARHPSVPVILRISLRPNDDFIGIAREILRAGYDAVDVRTGFSSMPNSLGKSVEQGYTLDLARQLRPWLDLPILTGGRILSPADAAAAITEIGLDAIVLGRPLLADSQWANKAFGGEEVTLCKYDCDPSCYSCFKQGEPLRCVYWEQNQ